MTLVKYSFFQMGQDNTAFDLFVSRGDPTLASHHVLIFGRVRSGTAGANFLYQPYLAKFQTADFTTIAAQHATGAFSQSAPGVNVYVHPVIGRISVCESQATWVGGYQKNMVQTGAIGAQATASSFLLMLGYTGELSTTFGFNHYLTTTTLAVFTPGNELNAINFFDLYYKCETTPAASSIAMVFVIGSKVNVFKLCSQNIHGQIGGCECWSSCWNYI